MSLRLNEARNGWRNVIAPVALLVVLLLGSIKVYAQDARVFYTVTNPTPTQFNYEFRFVNNLNPLTFSGFDLYDVILSFSGSPTISVTNVPFGWTQIPLDGSVEFVSILAGQPPVGQDIAPSSSLSGFRITSDQDLSGTLFTAQFVDPGSPEQPRLFDGVIQPALAGATAPESSSLVYLISIFGCVGGSQMLRYCKSSRNKRF